MKIFGRRESLSEVPENEVIERAQAQARKIGAQIARGAGFTGDAGGPILNGRLGAMKLSEAIRAARAVQQAIWGEISG